MNMSSNKNIDLSEILSFDGKDEQLEFEVATLHFDFIEEIKNLMDKHLMKNKDLAVKLKVSESFISQLFAGEKLLSLKLLTRIQKIFDIRFRISTGQKQASQQVFVFVASQKTEIQKKSSNPFISSVYTTNESLQLNITKEKVLC